MTLRLPPPAPCSPPAPPADIPTLDAVRNPSGIAPVALPLTLRMLSHVPILVSSRRSQTSGSPTHCCAKLWLVGRGGAAAASATAELGAEAQL